DWCYTYIAAAVNSGIINGIEENKFGIGDTITREDMATILYRTAKKIGNERLDSEIKTKFSDHEEISDYAIDGIYAMKNLNIINGMGDGTFAPKSDATRAESAKMIFNLLESEKLK
ncbi:MAG: S-layer homology domain-containing protein, partial [Oscillospiraceae bacterium]